MKLISTTIDTTPTTFVLTRCRILTPEDVNRVLEVGVDDPDLEENIV